VARIQHVTNFKAPLQYRKIGFTSHFGRWGVLVSDLKTRLFTSACLHFLIETGSVVPAAAISAKGKAALTKASIEAKTPHSELDSVNFSTVQAFVNKRLIRFQIARKSFAGHLKDTSF